MKKEKDVQNPKNNSPTGTGSDKQHPETPPDANERFNKQEKGNIQENPGSQSTG